MADRTPEDFAQYLLSEVDSAQTGLTGAIERCIAAGKVTASCIQNCPLFAIPPDYSESKKRIRDSVTGEQAVPTRGLSLKNNVLAEISDWEARVEGVEQIGCSDGPTEEPRNWGEIDGQPTTTGVSYFCSQNQRLQETFEQG